MDQRSPSRAVYRPVDHGDVQAYRRVAQCTVHATLFTPVEGRLTCSLAPNPVRAVSDPRRLLRRDAKYRRLVARGSSAGDVKSPCSSSAGMAQPKRLTEYKAAIRGTRLLALVQS